MIRRLARRLLKRRLIQLTSEQSQLITQMRSKVAALPSLPSTDDSAAGADWLKNRNRLRQLIRSEDPRSFLEWDVLQQTMVVGNCSYIPLELKALRESPSWQSRWRGAIREVAAGRPDRCRWYLRSSGTLIHHAYSLLQFEQATGRGIETFDEIVEFGGGYGSFCRLARNCGFRGEYVIVDFPEFCALQEYFLESCEQEQGRDATSRIKFVTDLEDIAEIPLKSNSLFIALWSLSEAPVAVRDRALESLNRIPNVLLAYQDQFGEVDNTHYFATWMRERSNLQWRSADIAHLPGNRYLLGTAGG